MTTGAIPTKDAIKMLQELRALTSDENGAQRVAFTNTWIKTRNWFNHQIADLPVEHHRDAAGNNWVTLAGPSEKALILGSHLDSVPRRLARRRTRRFSPAWLFSAASQRNTTAGRPSPSASSTGPMKRGRASAAVSSDLLPLPVPRLSPKTASAPTRTASRSKMRSPRSTSTSTRSAMRSRSRRTPPPISNSTSSRAPSSNTSIFLSASSSALKVSSVTHHLSRTGGALRLHAHGCAQRRARRCREARA